MFGAYDDLYLSTENDFVENYFYFDGNLVEKLTILYVLSIFACFDEDAAKRCLSVPLKYSFDFMNFGSQFKEACFYEILTYCGWKICNYKTLSELREKDTGIFTLLNSSCAFDDCLLYELDVDSIYVLHNPALSEYISTHGFEPKLKMLLQKTFCMFVGGFDSEIEVSGYALSDDGEVIVYLLPFWSYTSFNYNYLHGIQCLYMPILLDFLKINQIITKKDACI